MPRKRDAPLNCSGMQAQAQAQAQALAPTGDPHPNKGEQMVRYYGFYSNKSRGLRKKAGTDDQVPALIDSDLSRKAFRNNWARLIQKIYNVNPLLCAKCWGSMRIISLIDDAQIIKKILKHLDLWDVRPKPSPRANSPPPESVIIYDECSSPGVDDYIIDTVYPN